MVNLSIIIITWNSLDLLTDCLTSLNIEEQSEGVEVLLVDNGSVDGTVSFVRQHYPAIKLLELGQNKGVAYARNRGIEQASGEYILLLDNDTVVNQQAIDGMMMYMQKNPQVGICGCRLVDINNRVQDSYKCYPGLDVKVVNVLKLKHIKYSLHEDLAKVDIYEPDYIIGACQLIRRMLIDEIGLLDEHIFYGPEDADYCLRAKAAHWKVCYLTQYTIIHHWQRATNRKLFSLLAYKHVRALFYFYWKHKRLFK